MSPKLFSFIVFGFAIPTFAIAADPSAQTPKLKFEAVGRTMPVENLSPETRLRQACDDTINLRKNLEASKLNAGASVSLAALQHVVCGDSGGPRP